MNYACKAQQKAQRSEGSMCLIVKIVEIAITLGSGVSRQALGIQIFKTPLHGDGA